MNKLQANDFQEIRLWMYRNARPIDLALWQYHFEQGDKEAVVEALSGYRNSDNGYGHALEPDNWNPNSTPAATGIAIAILDQIELSDRQHPHVKAILAYLEQCPYSSESGWPFSIPSNNDFPHAPWWTYSENSSSPMDFNPTAGLVGFILRVADESSALYDKALAIGDKMIDKIRKSEQVESHELSCYCGFLHDVQQTSLTDRYDCAFLADRLKKLVDDTIERDPGKWPSYSMRPSVYISSPASIFYRGNEEIVEKELEYILESRNAGGVWDISWKWTDYPNEFAIAENWWKAYWAIHNVLLLREFNRIN